MPQFLNLYSTFKYVPLNFLSYLRSLPVAQWLHFWASVRKSMAFSPSRGTPFFHLCVQIYLCFFLQSFFHDLSNQIMSVGKKYRLRKDIKSIWQKIICVILLGLFHWRCAYLSFCLMEDLITEACKRTDL